MSDQERAMQVADALSEVLDDMSGLYPAGVEIIAAALAAEREKARAPFRALADELEEPIMRAAIWRGERHAGQCEGEDAERLRLAARIRRAAEVEP